MPLNSLAGQLQAVGMGKVDCMHVFPFATCVLSEMPGALPLANCGSTYVVSLKLSYRQDAQVVCEVHLTCTVVGAHTMALASMPNRPTVARVSCHEAVSAGCRHASLPIQLQSTLQCRVCRQLFPSRLPNVLHLMFICWLQATLHFSSDCLP